MPTAPVTEAEVEPGAGPRAPSVGDTPLVIIDEPEIGAAPVTWAELATEAEPATGAEPPDGAATVDGEEPVPDAGAHATAGWDGSLKQAADWYTEFRTTRLHAQILLAVGLVALTWLSNLWPVGPLARIRQELVTAVTQDYDFRGQAVLANQWAGERGGWVPAVRGLWTAGVSRVQQRLHLPALPGRPPASQPNAQTGTQPTPRPTQQPATHVDQPATPRANPQPDPEPDTTGSDSTESPQPDAPRAMPVSGPVTYGYGWLPKGQQPHEGLDLAAKVGDPVVAMADGTVLRVGTDELAGALVEVDHGFAVVLYGQVTAARVKAGDHVQQGQQLAEIAKPTGKEGDTGVHLHLEVRPARGAKPIDPAPYLPLNGGSDI